jgi:formylglycine-generating enzyme required for sulfatase activity
MADIDLCSIPAGNYLIGDDANPISRPAHTVTLAAFSIGQIAVTNEQFAGFITAGGYTDESLWSVMGWRWQQRKQVTEPAFWQAANFNHALQPVVGVGWYEALAFVTWLARSTGQPWRLPSEIEWEAADGRTLPEDARRVNSVERGIGRPWGVFGVGEQSWCGAWDLCGNVWEWTVSRWGHNWQTLEYAYPYNPDDGRETLEGSAARVMRGGSYFDTLKEAHPTNRGRFLPGSRASNIGFRLALSHDL